MRGGRVRRGARAAQRAIPHLAFLLACGLRSLIRLTNEGVTRRGGCRASFAAAGAEAPELVAHNDTAGAALLGGPTMAERYPEGSCVCAVVHTVSRVRHNAQRGTGGTRSADAL